MSFTFKEIWAHMGPSAMLIAGLLSVMAVASLSIFFERLFVFGRSVRRNRAFARRATGLLKDRRLRDFVTAANEAKGSHLAELLGAGVAAYLERSGDKTGTLSALELARRELERASERAAASVRRGLSVLATVGSVSPFVGLLGTVVGIISAFQGIAKEGSGGLSAVSGGISESLVETALGLVVAIPAVLFYNLCATRSEALLRGLDQARSELLDVLEDLGDAPKLRPARDESIAVALAFPVESESHARAT